MTLPTGSLAPVGTRPTGRVESSPLQFVHLSLVAALDLSHNPVPYRMILTASLFCAVVLSRFLASMRMPVGSLMRLSQS